MSFQAFTNTQNIRYKWLIHQYKKKEGLDNISRLLLTLGILWFVVKEKKNEMTEYKKFTQDIPELLMKTVRKTIQL